MSNKPNTAQMREILAPKIARAEEKLAAMPDRIARATGDKADNLRKRQQLLEETIARYREVVS